MTRCRNRASAGHIAISTKRDGDSLEVAISDNGTGITDPQRIFDPFYTTKQVGKGTGLGLSICYGIVRARNGGEIQCWNNDTAAGSTFLVRVSGGNGTSPPMQQPTRPWRKRPGDEYLCHGSSSGANFDY